MTISNILNSVTVDRQVDAAYFAFLDAEVVEITRIFEAVETTTHGLIVDFTTNREGVEKVVGVEILKIPSNSSELLEDLNSLHFLRTKQKEAILAAVDELILNQK